MNNKAVSEVLGSVLLILIAIAVFGVLCLNSIDLVSNFFGDYPSNIQFEYYQENNQLVLFHIGGGTLKEYSLTVGETEVLGFGWEIGEYIYFDLTGFTGKTEFYLIDVGNNGIIGSGVIYCSEYIEPITDTQVGMIPSANIVNVGEDFTVTVYINPVNELILGWQIYLLNFTQETAICVGVVAGDVWELMFDGGIIDNVFGNVWDIQTWKMDNYPDYNHTACIISFTAVNSGIFAMELISVEVFNEVYDSIPIIIYSPVVVIIS